MNNKSRKMILLIIIFFMILLFICIGMYIYLINNMQIENNENANVIIGENTDIIDNSDEVSVKSIIEKHNSEYIDETDNAIYRINVVFGKDLYDKNGNSNESYFENLINELSEFINRNFILFDEQKDIYIEVIFNNETEQYKYIINNKENFFEEVNGEVYSEASNLEITDITENMNPTDKITSKLSSNNMFFNNIKDNLGEGVELDNGYISYLDNSILIKQNNGRVRNIVYTKNYNDEVFSEIKVGTSLKQIIESYPEYSFGGLDKDYLGYRTETNYIFFYEDEISIWEYFYYDNNTLENYVKSFLDNTIDTQELIDLLTSGWTNYKFYNEYNSETKSVHIIYPTRGIEIKVDGDLKEITIYSNYYLTKTMKELIYNKKVKTSEEDSIENEEIVRRSGNIN